MVSLTHGYPNILLVLTISGLGDLELDHVGQRFKVGFRILARCMLHNEYK